MASNSGRRYGSSDRSTRKRVVIGAEETVRVRYDKNQPEVESERRSTTRQTQRVASKRAGVPTRPAEHAGRRLASTKRDARARRQQVIKVRRFGLIGAALAVVFALLWGLVALYNAPIFSVGEVEVEGNRNLTDAQVVTAARMPEAATLVRLPADAMRRRLEAHPWVASARVVRDYPSTVRIEIEERVPGAVIDGGGTTMWVVSRDGFWLSERSAEDTGLVTVHDVGEVEPKAGERVANPAIRNALKVIAGLSEELRGNVRIVSAPSIEQTSLVTETDIEIFVGSADRIGDKDRIAREIMRKEKGKVVYINVRVVDRPTWRGL